MCRHGCPGPRRRAVGGINGARTDYGAGGWRSSCLLALAAATPPGASACTSAPVSTSARSIWLRAPLRLLAQLWLSRRLAESAIPATPAASTAHVCRRSSSCSAACAASAAIGTPEVSFSRSVGRSSCSGRSRRVRRPRNSCSLVAQFVRSSSGCPYRPRRLRGSYDSGSRHHSHRSSKLWLSVPLAPLPRLL